MTQNYFDFDVSELVPMAETHNRNGRKQAEKTLTVSINKNGTPGKHDMRIGFHGELAEIAKNYGSARALYHPRCFDGMWIYFRQSITKERDGWYKIQANSGYHFQFGLSDEMDKLVRRRYVGKRFKYEIVSQDLEKKELTLFVQVEAKGS